MGFGFLAGGVGRSLVPNEDGKFFFRSARASAFGDFFPLTFGSGAVRSGKSSLAEDVEACKA